jgi:hypothetical protein
MRISLGFRNAYVFDIAQTTGAELPAMQAHCCGRGVERSGSGGEIARLYDLYKQLEFSDLVSHDPCHFR